MNKNTTLEFTDINKVLFAALLYRVVSVIIVIFTLSLRHTLPQWMIEWFRLVSYPLLIFSFLSLIFYKKIAEFLSKYFWFLFVDLFITVGIIQIGGSWRSSYFGYTITTIILFTIFDNKRGAYFSSIVLIIAAIIKDPAGGLPSLETFQVNSWDMRLGSASMYLTTGLILGYISDLIVKIEALSKARMEENEKLMLVRMGLELHDGAKPMVTAMILKMHSLMKKAGLLQKDIVEDIQWLWRGMNYLQTELDQIISLLRAESKKNDLAKIQPAQCNVYEIAEESIKITGAMTGFSWEIIADSKNFFIPLNNKTPLRRFLNEAQINAWKHSGINAGTINLKSIDSNLEIIVHDKGRGFIHMDSNAAKLMSLKHRAKELKGDLNIDTAPDKGCRLTLTFPIGN